MNRRLRVPLAAVLLVAAAGSARSAAPPAAANLEQRAAVIRPEADERKWERIPWLTHLAEAQQVARIEHRPLFVWITGDDPLERC